jgi:hypothetical protein
VQVPLGAEWWAEPIEQPADRDTIATYDADPQVLTRWREARDAYLAAWASVRSNGKAGERQRALPTSTSMLCSTVRRGAHPPRLVDVEDDQRRSMQYGEWVRRDDGYWVFADPYTLLMFQRPRTAQGRPALFRTARPSSPRVACSPARPTLANSGVSRDGATAVPS